MTILELECDELEYDLAEFVWLNLINRLAQPQLACSTSKDDHSTLNVAQFFS
jgi:hypothetical protein